MPFYKKRVPKALIDTKNRWMMIIIVLDKIGAGTNGDQKHKRSELDTLRQIYILARHPGRGIFRIH